MELFPATTVATLSQGFLDVVVDNIAIILALMGIFWGVKYIFTLFKTEGLNQKRFGTKSDYGFDDGCPICGAYPMTANCNNGNCDTGEFDRALEENKRLTKGL